ncbi:MAG: hypothetical protein OSA45_09390 [Halioglobus sp.]|nr:hypothetical protein [Halioglobus sp.]
MANLELKKYIVWRKSALYETHPLSKHNPQMAVIYGLISATGTHVIIEGEKVFNSDFHNFPVLRMNEMLGVKVMGVDSIEKPSGLGGVAVPLNALSSDSALVRL